MSRAAEIVGGIPEPHVSARRRFRRVSVRVLKPERDLHRVQLMIHAMLTSVTEKESVNIGSNKLYGNELGRTDVKSHLGGCYVAKVRHLVGHNTITRHQTALTEPPDLSK